MVKLVDPIVPDADLPATTVVHLAGVIWAERLDSESVARLSEATTCARVVAIG
jgi:hypothetical protein